jgi:ketosteroid isomerase-like protein
MVRTLGMLLAGTLLCGHGIAFGAEPAPAARELTGLLRSFLDGASRNEIAAHERFWADELVYTSSAGERTNKPEILAGLRDAPDTPEEPLVYSAEDIRIRQYGDLAVVAFRLVGMPAGAAGKSPLHYLNTGTFLRRDGEWRAVAWQATREAEPARPVPAQEAEVNLTPGAAARPGLAAEIQAADAAFFRAFFDTCDIEAVRRFVADDFEMFHDKGGRVAASGAEFVKSAEDKCRRQAEGTDFLSTRRLVPDTLQVYPLNNFGAISTGNHEFFAVKQGAPDRLTETGRFTIVWKEENGTWKLARALSYDHVLAP